jgi:hypothetical protein
MKQLVKCTALSLLATVVALSGCSSDDDDDTASTSVFEFRTDQPDAYARVDRSGMPAIATALIASRDAYNDANPSDDIAGTFVPEILNSLTALHGALDGQLTDLGFTPCTVVGDGTGSCAAFAVPLIIPDTVKIDTSATAGFPNGRQLTDPVVAVTLAVALLELTGDPAPHAPDALVGVVNPTANDKEFLGSFPFLAEPFQP